jgi:hypothetical protein
MLHLPKLLRKKLRQRQQRALFTRQFLAAAFYEPNFKLTPHKVTDGYKPSRPYVDRIKRSYRLTFDAYLVSDKSMWSHISKMRRPAHDALLGDDDRALAMLCDPGSACLLFGLDESFTGDWSMFAAANDFDKLVRLSEALGCRRTYNPEPSYFLEHETLPTMADVDREVDRICSALGLPADFTFKSPFLNTLGIATRRGPLDQRTIQSLYQARRLRQLGGNHVLEIGGGVGRAAYYALTLGASSYTIVDLPLTLVVQALFLGALLGEDPVRLAGEDDDGQKVHLLTPNMLPERRFDIAFNCDSLTEMAVDQAREYVEYFKRTVPLLLSINHEANSFTVASLLPQTVHRYPYWLRKGYVEELFSFG